MSTLRAAAADADPIRSAWGRRALLRELSVREIRSRFTGSLLGAGWLVLQPLASLAVYAVVFGGILGLADRGGGGMAFVTRLFAGLIVFQAFAEPVARASRLVVSRPNLVTKVVFPLEILPWPLIAASALNAAVSLVLLVALHAVFVATPPVSVLLLPLVLVPVLALAAGASWFLASLGVFVRDTHEVVRIALQLMFFLSPVVWTTDLATAPLHRALVAWNPIATAIDSARAALAGTPPPGTAALLALAAAAIAVAGLGHAFFRRTSKGFADVL